MKHSTDRTDGSVLSVLSAVLFVFVLQHPPNIDGVFPLFMLLRLHLECERREINTKLHTTAAADGCLWACMVDNVHLSRFFIAKCRGRSRDKTAYFLFKNIYVNKGKNLRELET